ncbi:MAG TPA: hypothetical protein VLI92_05310, partial [Candidatus Saccharimonadales bacterium]|nr:hypothetical protein [Candidatus Saccharimonadales bacterium]
AKHTLAAFIVKNLEKAIEEMTANGIKFEHYNIPGLKTDKMGVAVSKVEGEKAAWFKDPDGNILAVSQML